MNILPLPAFTDNYIWLIEENGKATVVDPGDAKVVNSYLKENGLKELEKISDITSRLIVNKSSFKSKYKEINEILRELKKHV